MRGNVNKSNSNSEWQRVVTNQLGYNVIEKRHEMQEILFCCKLWKPVKHWPKEWLDWVQFLHKGNKNTYRAGNFGHTGQLIQTACMVTE